MTIGVLINGKLSAVFTKPLPAWNYARSIDYGCTIKFQIGDTQFNYHPTRFCSFVDWVNEQRRRHT